MNGLSIVHNVTNRSKPRLFWNVTWTGTKDYATMFVLFVVKVSWPAVNWTSMRSPTRRAKNFHVRYAINSLKRAGSFWNTIDATQVKGLLSAIYARKTSWRPKCSNAMWWFIRVPNLTCAICAIARTRRSTCWINIWSLISRSLRGYVSKPKSETVLSRINSWS